MVAERVSGGVEPQSLHADLRGGASVLRISLSLRTFLGKGRKGPGLSRWHGLALLQQQEGEPLTCCEECGRCCCCSGAASPHVLRD
eukprot:2193336-Amphidinium_carterae.1